MDKQHQHDQSQQGRVRGSDIATFVAALLAALGLHKAADWLRHRQSTKQREQQQQAQAQHEATITRLHDAGYEQTDARFGLLAGILAGSVVFAVMLSLVLWVLFNYFANRPVSPPGPITQLNPPAQLPAAPRLQADPQSDWLRLRATQTALLNSYGVDPTSGAIHIPIEHAMELVATRGLSATGGLAPAAPAPTAQGGQP
ncbi:MAG TPA: hypothetical protein VFT66_18105 [Roseiflexaceae bacterium]|jgi:hypothetical protein|nr:hypothetical protein [Roseiflexaceae bacterium]